MDTTIQVKKSVRDQLEKLKVHPREALGSVVERLIKNNVDAEPFSDDEIRGIERGLEDIRAGRTRSVKEARKQLGMK